MDERTDGDDPDTAIAAARVALERRPMRTEPLARWEGARPVEALDPAFAPMDWILSRAKCVDRAQADADRPEPVVGWAAAALASGKSVRHLQRLAACRPDLFVYDSASGFPGFTTLWECRSAFRAFRAGVLCEKWRERTCRT